MTTRSGQMISSSRFYQLEKRFWFLSGKNVKGFVDKLAPCHKSDYPSKMARFYK